MYVYCPSASLWNNFDLKSILLDVKMTTKHALKRKTTPESGIELYSVFKEINSFKNGIKGIVISGQNLTQLYFQLVKRN